MKTLLILLAIGAISCGKYENVSSKNGSVGSFKSLSPVSISQSEKMTLTSVCNALAQKAAVLSVSTGSSFSFQSQQSDCSGNIISSGLVNVTLQSSSGSFSFKKPDGSDFIFPDVETNTTGMLSQVCPALSTASNPIQVDQDYLYVTTSVNSSECLPVSGEVCVQVEKGSVVSGQVQIHTIEIMRVRTQSNNNRLIGFFTHRKKYARAYCGDNEALSLQASLK